MLSRIYPPLSRSAKHRAKAARSNEKFNAMLKTERSLERIQFDHEKIDWDEDPDYPNTDRVKIGKIEVPQSEFKLLRDPTGWRGPRDKKHLKMVERMQRRERERKLREPKPKSESIRQIRVADNILEKLNEILEDGIEDAPDPTGATIASPILMKSGVRFRSVQISKDLKTATCIWECKETYQTQVRDQLSAFKTKIRSLLTSRVAMKFSPRLVFKYNDKKIFAEEAERAMDELEDKIKNNPIQFDEDDKTIPELTREEKIAHYKEIAKTFADMGMATQNFENEWLRVTGKPAAYQPPQKESKSKKTKSGKLTDVVRDNFSQYFAPTEQAEKSDPAQEME